MHRRLILYLPLLTLGVTSRLHAEGDVAVPIPLQVELLVKVAAYDKNLPARAGNHVRALVLDKPGNPGSSQVAQQVARLIVQKTVANRPVQAALASFSDAGSLARRVAAEKFAILYMAPGFSDAELEGIAAALRGQSVLSAGAVARFSHKGVVLSFDLVGGKPKLLVHLGRAKAQNVELSSQILKLVKVVE